MKIYATPGNATQYTPKGDGSAAQRVMSYSWGTTTPIKTGPIPTEVSAATEKNKTGSRRVLLKVATTMPKTVVDMVAPASNGQSQMAPHKDLRIQTHLVVECDEDLVRQSAALADASEVPFGDMVAGQIIKDQLRAIVAMVLGVDSLPASIDAIPKDSPLYVGLLGLNPLDTVSGVYGKTTV